MKKSQRLKKLLGFNEAGPDSVKDAYFRHLLRAAKEQRAQARRANFHSAESCATNLDLAKGEQLSFDLGPASKKTLKSS